MCEMMKKLTKINLEQISFWLLCAIVFDCAALGGGTIVELFGIDIRMVLYGAFFLCSLPCVLRNFRRILSNRFVLILLAWGLWIIGATVRGILAGNRMDLIISGWVGFASFGILPGAICVLKDRERIGKVMGVVCAAAGFLALQSLFVLIVYQLDLDAFVSLNLYMIQQELGGCTGVDDTVVRIFFRSHPLMVFGCACSLYRAVKGEKKGEKLLHCANIGLCLFSLLLSYTRSIYLCMIVCIAAVVAGGCFVLEKEEIKRMWKRIAGAVSAFAAVLLLCDVLLGAGFLNYGVYRSVGVDVLNRVEVSLGLEDGALGGGYEVTEATKPKETKPKETKPRPQSTKPTTDASDPDFDINAWSDDLRGRTVAELMERIKQKPLTGSGMGAALDARADGYNEYFYLDQIYKTGLIGILLYMAPMALMALAVLEGRKKEDAFLRVVWLAGLGGIAAFSALNPYLNGSNGIVLYCCTIAVFSAYNQKNSAISKKSNRKEDIL